MEELSLPATMLKNIFLKRQERNEKYSLRSFARDLSISHALLSLVFSGKRSLTPDISEKIADKLNMSAKLRKRFLQNYIEKEKSETYALEMEKFMFLSEWQHYAILSLFHTCDFRMDHKWIAERLGTSEMLVQESVRRLVRLGIIEEKDGKWVRKAKDLRFPNQKSTVATRRFQSQLLKKAAESLQRDSFEEREVSSLTFAMSPQNIDYAREKIRQFRYELSEELESLGPKEEVYNLTVQICPVTRRKK